MMWLWFFRLTMTTNLGQSHPSYASTSYKAWLSAMHTLGLILTQSTMLPSNLVLATGLNMWIGHRKEIKKPTFQALALHQSGSDNAKTYSTAKVQNCKKNTVELNFSNFEISIFFNACKIYATAFFLIFPVFFSVCNKKIFIKNMASPA